MSRRDYSQKTFADTLVEGRSRRRKRLDRLERVEGLLDWERIDRLLDGINAERRGGRGYPPLCMLKALLLAQWHDLSDPGLEDALADRLSFRRFCGFPPDEETPDETSFVRFRAKLRNLGLYERLFAEVNRQLEARVYGDKAYGSQKNRDFLSRMALGIGDRLMYKAARNEPLKPWQEWFNKAVSAVRSGVERVFGTGKTGYGLGRTCYFGEARVEVDCYTFAIAYNLRRALRLA